MVLEIQKGLVCGDDCGVNFYQSDEANFTELAVMNMKERSEGGRKTESSSPQVHAVTRREVLAGGAVRMPDYTLV
jgi:hypothetical protein